MQEALAEEKKKIKELLEKTRKEMQAEIAKEEEAS